MKNTQYPQVQNFHHYYPLIEKVQCVVIDSPGKHNESGYKNRYGYCVGASSEVLKDYLTGDLEAANFSALLVEESRLVSCLLSGLQWASFTQQLLRSNSSEMHCVIN